VRRGYYGNEEVAVKVFPRDERRPVPEGAKELVLCASP